MVCDHIIDIRSDQILSLIHIYSVMQYYRKCVVGRIEYHIQQQDQNFTELADLFNFSSIHYFSKFYKRETGCTLREYLKNSQE